MSDERATRRRSFAAVLVAVALAACSGGDDTSGGEVSGSASTTTVPVAPSTSAPSGTVGGPADAVEEAAVATLTTVPRELMKVVRVDPVTGEVTEVEEEASGPATFNDVVDFGIEAGLWDEIGGLERVLGYIAGGVDAAQVPGVGDVVIAEFGDVLARANQLAIDGHATGDELANLQGWYEVLVPPHDFLDTVAESSGASPQGFAMRQPASTADDSCVPVDVDSADPDIWVAGCYRMVEEDLGDALLRVFYPAWYEADGSLAGIPSVALEALVSSIETYRSLGNVGDIDVIVSAADTPTFSAAATAGVTAQWNTETVVGCPVSVAADVTRYRPANFGQVIAHEAWHCTQHYDGFPTTVVGGSAWYREGGAHYFSNLVFPSANYEHYYTLEEFDDGLDTPIFEMSYEAWIVWQYLGNEIGARAVADLHREMMAAGNAAPQSMRPYQQQFHDFTVDYVAGTVLDQNGEALPRPTRYHVFPLVDKQSVGSTFELSLDPLTVMRWTVEYDKELRVLETDASTNALNSMVKWSERTDRPAWRGIHPEVRSSCRDKTRYVGATTNAERLHTLKVTIDVVEEASCDPCLLGTWSLDLGTFQQMLVAGMEAEGGGLPPGTSFAMTGAYYISFDEESVVLEQRDGLTIIASSQGFSIPVTIDSFAEGDYSADGERVIVSSLIESYNQVTVGGPVGFDTSAPSVIAQGFGSYECRQDTLQVTADGFDAVTFERVDKILQPPASPSGDE